MIELRGIGKSFDGGNSWAVRGAHLAVSDGQFVALVGSSGSGKTTLLKMINRLVDPDEGEVRVAGRPVAAEPAHVLRRRIGYVFQGIGLFPHLTVAENIAVTPRLLGWPADEVAARVAELLALVELPADFASRLPSAMSGGQRQRVGVARALAARPRFLLMDEPFGALDPVTRDTLARGVCSLHHRLGLTTIMVTHDMAEALIVADRIVVLSDGRIVADETPRGLFSAPQPPPVAALLDVPRRQAAAVAALAGSALPGTEGRPG